MDVRILGLSMVVSAGMHGLVGWASWSMGTPLDGRGERPHTEVSVRIEPEAERAEEHAEEQAEEQAEEPPEEPAEPSAASPSRLPSLPERPEPAPERTPPRTASLESRVEMPEPERDRESTVELAKPPERPSEGRARGREEELRRQLDPARVAREALVPTSPEGRSDAAGADPAAARSRELSEELYREANAKPWLERTEPELEEGAGGTYRYDGHVFDAVIRPDGTVRFADGMDDRFDVGEGQASARFGFTEAIMRARGEDPHAAERRWFLRETKELRERLAREHHQERTNKGVLALRGELRRTWRSDEPASERRRAIFEMWDRCSEDEVGKPARRAIEAFVRDNLPASSSNAFTKRELERLNADRSSSDRFAPYQ